MMKTKVVSMFASLALFVGGCGGGGGSESGACSTLRSANKIAGGESCEDGQPSVTYVYTSSAAGSSGCTGAYISTTAVLTAAHCFAGKPTEVQIASRGVLRTGTAYYIHPLYDGRTGSPFDMAILKVDRPMTVAPLPVLLSTSPSRGDEVVAYGYGQDQNGREALGRIEAGEAPLKATYAEYNGYQGGVVTVLSTGEGSQCPGDSGGPVIAKNGNGSYGIIGITIAGPNGCSAEDGRPVELASTQSQGAVAFITRHVPDVAVN